MVSRSHPCPGTETALARPSPGPGSSPSAVLHRAAPARQPRHRGAVPPASRQRGNGSVWGAEVARGVFGAVLQVGMDAVTQSRETTPVRGTGTETPSAGEVGEKLEQKGHFGLADLLLKAVSGKILRWGGERCSPARKNKSFREIKACSPTSRGRARHGSQVVPRKAGTSKGTLGTNPRSGGTLGAELAGQGTLCAHGDRPARAGGSLSAHYRCSVKRQK